MADRYLTNEDLEARFSALDAFLVAHQSLWRPAPFTERELSWERTHPKLSAWLRCRSLAEADAQHTTPHELNAPAPFGEWASQALQLAALGPLPSQQIHAVSNRLSVDVPGRKWTQIQAFAGHLAFQHAPSHWLDWCAGKGHLGRVLAGKESRLTALEHDPQLVADGQALSERHGLIEASHIQQDVLQADVLRHLGHDTTPVALHACGDLHTTLIQHACTANVPALAVAPCCYNRTNATVYVPFSQRGKASALQLDRKDLGLPMTETVTAGQRVRQQRDQSMARRLAFDLLQRRLRGVDAYLPTPSLDTCWLKQPLSAFCAHLAECKGIELPPQIDWQALETAGWERLAEVRNLELVRGLFRRPLEMWLLLDRALLLSEHGYRVNIGTFCPPDVTPRNVMLLAERDD
ncbi:methyltransferase [Pseudomonas matsuisoli]|uniref:SAM-dependent methyltransferase n=1 Tax=Pseudomonas matsuisoli TaxID=1515666 RepID=A0A917UT78_9PSED|nr:methyltransferase [Pseudomonas matsuisoli]GGJ83716.1 SAM-dependent methyltransferase [Pseudomonas matsuisoli]